MLKKRIIILLLICISFTANACALYQKPSYQYNIRTTFIFGSTAIALSIEYPNGDFEEAFQKIISEMDVLNRQININDADLPDTDILRLNLANAEKKIEIGFHSYTLLQKAKEIYAATDAAFNIAAYPLSYLWAVDTCSLNGLDAPSFLNSDIISAPDGGFPSLSEIERVKQMCNLDMLTLTVENGKYYAKKASEYLKLDLGGIAKGYAADLCNKIMKEYNIPSGLINISGNIFTRGECYNNGGKWQIAINNPEKSFGLAGIICAVSIDGDTTILTSGEYERYRIAAHPEDLDTKVHLNHMMDTSTGLPYGITQEFFDDELRVVSCTIIGTNSVEADAYATAVCVKGLDAGISLLQQTGLSAVIFTADKKMAIVGDVKLIDRKEANAYKSKYEIVYHG